MIVTFRQRELEHENLMEQEEQSTEPDWNNIAKMCLLHSSKHGKERMKKLLVDIKDPISRLVVAYTYFAIYNIQSLKYFCGKMHF